MGAEYEYLPGYSDIPEYSDDMLFEYDKDLKEVSLITGQTLIAGERNSQAIFFKVPRYYDNIDLTTKHIQVIYIGPSGYSDINTAVCAMANDDFLKFAWLVPAGALLEPGTLRFCLEFSGDDYSLKSRAIEQEVFDGLTDADIAPEPVEKQWYIELQDLCAETLEDAQNFAIEAKNARNAAQTAQTAAETAEDAATAAAVSAAASAEGAAASAEDAAAYAETAANTFAVVGDVSFAVNSEDGSVIMYFTVTEE